MNDPEPRGIEKGTYRHTKSGKLYEVIGVALETETNDQLVVYRPMYTSEHELFARSYNIFIETIELDSVEVPRFEKIDE